MTHKNVFLFSLFALTQGLLLGADDRPWFEQYKNKEISYDTTIIRCYKIPTEMLERRRSMTTRGIKQCPECPFRITSRRGNILGLHNTARTETNILTAHAIAQHRMLYLDDKRLPEFVNIHTVQKENDIPQFCSYRELAKIKDAWDMTHAADLVLPEPDVSIVDGFVFMAWATRPTDEALSAAHQEAQAPVDDRDVFFVPMATE